MKDMFLARQPGVNLPNMLEAVPFLQPPLQRSADSTCRREDTSRAGGGGIKTRIHDYRMGYYRFYYESREVATFVFVAWGDNTEGAVETTSETSERETG